MLLLCSYNGCALAMSETPFSIKREVSDANTFNNIQLISPYNLLTVHSLTVLTEKKTLSSYNALAATTGNNTTCNKI